MKERVLKPRFAGPRQNGRRVVTAETLDEMDRVAAEAAAEMTEFFRQSVRDHLEGIAGHIKEEWMEGGHLVRGEQEVVLRTRGVSPFFEITTRPVR